MKFRTAIFSGYDKAEVDAFVARVVAALEGPHSESAITEIEIAETEFRQGSFGSAYRKGDVDKWLDEAEYELHTRRHDH